MSLALRVSALLVPFLLIASDSLTPPIGKPAPPLTLNRTPLSGDVPAWQDLHGGPVVLEFWGTWCAQCVAAIPHLNELASKVKSVRFISITDDRHDVVEKFLAQHPMEGIVAFDQNGSTHAAYGVSSYPHTALVDANGILRGVVSPSQLGQHQRRHLIVSPSANGPGKIGRNHCAGHQKRDDNARKNLGTHQNISFSASCI